MQNNNDTIAETIQRNAPILVIDVRDYDYGQGGTICGSVHIPHSQYSKIQQLVARTDSQTPVAVTCMYGASRSVKVIDQLKHDFQDRKFLLVEGGISGFQREHREVMLFLEQ